MTLTFENKTAIITGGASGVGLALAGQLLSAGANVTLVDRDAAALSAAVQQLGTERVLPVEADTSRRDDVRRYVNETVARFGRVDLFANNAAIVGEQRALLDSTEADFLRVFSVNVLGVLMGMQEVAKVMRRHGGSMVNTASVSGQRSSRPGAGLGVYGGSKAAVIRMTQQAALEFAPLGIRVNAICPGPIETPLLRSTFRVDGHTEEEVTQALNQHFRSQPLGRAARAGEVADVAFWLLGSRASFVTGSIYNVDGGMTA